MIKDEEKNLEEVMNYRSFKLLHGHVIANGNILLRHSLLKPLPCKTFTPKKGHGATTWRFRQGNFKGIRQIQVEDLHCRWLFDRSRRDNKTNFNNLRFGRPMPSLLMASMTRKTSHIYHLG